MNSKVRCIIVLDGGYLPVDVSGGTEADFSQNILDALKLAGDEHPFLYFALQNRYVRKKSVIGWYFTEIPPDPVDKMIKFMDSKIPDKDEGDDWKK